MAQGTPAAGGLHSVVMSHSRSNFDRKRRVAVASALVAAALVACAVVSTSTSSPEAEGSWLGRPTELAGTEAAVPSLKASSANVLGGAAALKSIHPATNTLSLFDTTAADHDGEKWSPPPKISPQEAREREAEKALKKADKRASSVKEVNVRDEPAIRKMEQSLVSAVDTKADTLTTTHAERAAAYQKIKAREQEKQAEFEAKVEKIRESTKAAHEEEKKIKARGHEETSAAHEPKAHEDGAKQYDDWYSSEYKKSLAKVMKERRQFDKKAKEARSPYEGSYKAALALDSKRQAAYREDMSNIRSGMSAAEAAKIKRDADYDKAGTRAKAADEAALEKQVDEITGSLDEKPAAATHATSAKSGEAAGKVAMSEKRASGVKKAKAKGADEKSSGKEAKWGKSEEPKSDIPAEKKSSTKGQSLKSVGAGKKEEAGKMREEMREESRRAEHAREAEQAEMEKRSEADRQAEDAMGRKAREEEQAAEAKLSKAGWGDASSVGAGSRKV